MTMNLPRTIEWVGDSSGHVRLLDQTRLPTEVVYRDCRDLESVRAAIGLVQLGKVERNNQRRASFPRARHLPGVELLEDRRLLSLTPAFNYAGSTNGYAIAAADFNNDGLVSSVDFILMKRTFGMEGAPPLTPDNP